MLVLQGQAGLAVARRAPRVRAGVSPHPLLHGGCSKEGGPMSRRDGELAHHIRRLGNHELNELLLQLPKASFAALVEVALARPALPAGLVLRYEPAAGVDGWTAVACAPRRRLGILTRD